MEERKTLLVGAHPSPVRCRLYTQWETLFDSPSQVLEMAMESDASPENSMAQEFFMMVEDFCPGLVSQLFMVRSC